MQITTVLFSLALTVSASSNTPDFNPNGFSRSAIDSWMTCNSGDTCNTPGYKCCVAPADAANGSGKTTCRPSSDCSDYVIPNNNAPNQQPGWIADWQNCSSNSCASSGFTCCVAPNDFNTGKTTCRPTYDCYNPNYQNTGSTGPSTGNVNQGYQNTGTSPTTQNQVAHGASGNSQNMDSTGQQTGDNGAPSFVSEYEGSDSTSQGAMSRASSYFVQGDPSTNDNSNAGSYDSYAQDNSASSSSSCVYGAWACGQDGVTLFQCSYVQGNVLSWRQHSQCQQGLICINKSGDGGNGFVGCDYPTGASSW
ncbi:hypothetical protein BCR33DRAFT_766418 [Rhizoclosmatium globosum]|uniref:CBM1 domain-containing protein n=1 Tax=Rhizoclosmatium globosum TaxID=329046 RepID=A0A1Y2CA06_9FUNG|nr:hypothetical protein BCR33DRAFT_766418 [Rhizoclosmatium globosum]|eukprot:ORY43727.1 hypothetical protein BCR33DRAFT_766418 [Rhizoclosmatium globosum]